MGQLSTDAIVTLASAIPGLLIASLSAWLSYTTLRRRYISRNDVETLTIEFIVVHTSTNPRPTIPSSSSHTSSTISSQNKPFPQLQLPPAALLRDFEWDPRQPRSSSPPTMSDEEQPISVGEPH